MIDSWPPLHDKPCQMDRPIITVCVCTGHRPTPNSPPSHISVNVGVTQANKLATQV